MKTSQICRLYTSYDEQYVSGHRCKLHPEFADVYF